MTEISAFNQAQLITCQAINFFLWPVEELLSKILDAVEWDFLFFWELFGQSLLAPKVRWRPKQTHSTPRSVVRLAMFFRLEYKQFRKKLKPNEEPEDDTQNKKVVSIRHCLRNSRHEFPKTSKSSRV